LVGDGGHTPGNAWMGQVGGERKKVPTRNELGKICRDDQKRGLGKITGNQTERPGGSATGWGEPGIGRPVYYSLKVNTGMVDRGHQED